MAFSVIKSLFHYPAVHYVEAIAEGRRCLFRLTPIYENPSWGGALFDFLTRTTGYHGTSEARVADQIKRGEFDKQDKPIYVDSKKVTTEYAIRAGLDGSQPLVLRVSSDIKTKMNDWLNNENLGWYSYYPPDPEKRVVIEAAYRVESLGETEESINLRKSLEGWKWSPSPPPETL